MKLKSLDLSAFAHVNKTKVNRWEFIKHERSNPRSVAIITPCRGKGFKFRGNIFPTFGEVLEVARNAKTKLEKGIKTVEIPTYSHYRQGGTFTKRGELNAIHAL